jgi:hypothetical protein
MFDALKPLIMPGPPEEDWLPLMHMLRDKSIHLGQATLRQVGLYDASVKAYVFIPRKWPFIWERDVKRYDPAVKADKAHMPSLLSGLLINQDILSFTVGLHKKVIAVVRAAIVEVLDMYRAFENFDTNVAAIAELEQNSVTFRFEHFVETPNLFARSDTGGIIKSVCESSPRRHFEGPDSSEQADRASSGVGKWSV